MHSSIAVIFILVVTTTMHSRNLCNFMGDIRFFFLGFVSQLVNVYLGWLYNRICVIGKKKQLQTHLTVFVNYNLLNVSTWICQTSQTPVYRIVSTWICQTHTKLSEETCENLCKQGRDPFHPRRLHLSCVVLGERPRGQGHRLYKTASTS